MIMIVSKNGDLARIWARHLERQNNIVSIVSCEADAIETARSKDIEVVVLDLSLEQSGCFLVADYVSYRQPSAKIVFVTRSGFFSDGSLFQHVPNTAAILQQNAPPSDLAEIVAYHGRLC